MTVPRSVSERPHFGHWRLASATAAGGVAAATATGASRGAVTATAGTGTVAGIATASGIATGEDVTISSSRSGNPTGSLAIAAGSKGSEVIGSPESCAEATLDMAQPVVTTATTPFATPSTVIISLPSPPSAEPWKAIDRLAATMVGGVRITDATSEATLLRQKMAHHTRPGPVSGYP